MLDKPVKSLGRWYEAALNDKEEIQGLRHQVVDGFKSIETPGLPGKPGDLNYLYFTKLFDLFIHTFCFFNHLANCRKTVA